MHILGLTHPMAWNNAACLISDGVLVRMVEEERLNRFKQSHGIAPNKAIDHCLESAGLTLDDVHFVAVGWDPAHYRKRKEKYISDFQFKQLPVDIRDKRVRFIRHHLTHALSAFTPSPFSRANVITLDGRGELESGLLGLGDGDDFQIIEPIPLHFQNCLKKNNFRNQENNLNMFHHYCKYHLHNKVKVCKNFPC